MKILFATGNQGKMREIREILKDLGTEILSLKDAGIDIDIPENGASFEENAKIKTRAIGVRPDTIVMSDDSGLCVDALNGGPGIYSARYMGEDTPYAEKNRSIIEKLKDVKGAARSAAFRCAVAVLFPDGTEAVAFGEMPGRIAEEPAGEGGFGYDPILFLPAYGMTSAEIPAEVKNEISHRKKALEGAKTVIREWMDAHAF